MGRFNVLIGISLFASSAFAAGVEEVEDKSVLVVDFANADAVTDGTVRLVNEVVAAAFGSHAKLAVLTNKDLERVVGLEADRQAAGCEDDTSCLSELGDALGADWVVSGTVGALGDLNVVSVVVAQGVEAIDRFRVQSKDPAELPDLLDARIADVLGRLFPDDVQVTEPEPEPAKPLLGDLQWAGVGIAAGAAVLTVVSSAVLAAADGTIADRTTSRAEKLEAQDTGVLMLVGVGVGVGALVAGGGMILLGRE